MQILYNILKLIRKTKRQKLIIEIINEQFLYTLRITEITCKCIAKT